MFVLLLSYGSSRSDNGQKRQVQSFFTIIILLPNNSVTVGNRGENDTRLT